MRIEFDGRKLAAAMVAAPVAVVAALNQYTKILRVPEDDLEGPYPGDELLPEPEASISNYVIDIDAPPEKVWPLINQLGQTKAGFYSFSLLERLTHFLIHNTYTPQARWQHTAVGDYMFFGQQGIGMEVVLHEPGKHLVGRSDTRKPPTQEGAIAWLPAGTKEFAWTWGFFLEPLPNGGTRLLSRSKGYAELGEGKLDQLKALTVAGLMWGWSSGPMTTRMLQVIRASAEGRHFIPS